MKKLRINFKKFLKRFIKLTSIPLHDAYGNVIKEYRVLEVFGRVIYESWIDIPEPVDEQSEYLGILR